jgi:PKD repeat protein
MNQGRVRTHFEQARRGGRAAAFLVACLSLCVVALMGGEPGTADTAPPNPADPKTPVTVSADALPTAQIDGVGWYQTIIGNTVYVVGSFSTARPAGAAPGQQTVARKNILAYNLTTGALIPTFAPVLNAQALAVAASPDGSVLYVGGDFTTVNGASAQHIAALNPTTGARISTFAASAGGQVRAIAATSSTVYFGGNFTTANSANRARLAAVRANDGGLLPWAPNADAKVNALAISPSGSQVVVGGAFTTLNGLSQPGYGLGAVSASTGASQLPFPVNDTVRNAGPNAAILSLASDSQHVYGTGYVFGSGGNFEGTFSANWSDGSINWLEDCHGDTYGAFPSPTAVYTVGHAHYCGNLGGYPETSPRSWHRAIAFGKAATGVLTHDPYGYPSFTGVAAPSLLNWYPDMDAGTYTGQNQGPWAVTGNSNYVAMSGEFKNVNFQPQQGLVRYAVSSIAPNQQGPRVGGTAIQPTLSSPSSGSVRLTWTANWDRDNTNLTYRIFRDGGSTPVATLTQVSTFWQRPTMTYLDSGLTGGSHSYRLTETDPFGNTQTSPTVSIGVQQGSNVGPQAAFSFSTAQLVAMFDGSASSDSDGSISSYAWAFGDGATGTGATPSHTYAAAGTYQVTLTVTDDDGATNAITKPVTVGVIPPGGNLAADAFGRTVSGGWGTADTGGPWTRTGGPAGNFSVASGRGRISMTAAGAGTRIVLGPVSAASVDVSLKLAQDKIANAGSYLSLLARTADTNAYSAKVKIAANGSLVLYLMRTVGGVDTTLASMIPPATYAAGQQLQVRLQATGSAPTTLRAKVWPVGAAEPGSWQVTTTDSTAGLQSPGGVGVTTYMAGSSTNLPVLATFDDLLVTEP